MLEREQVPATLFLNSRWIEANPALAGELAANPAFLIGNHGTKHKPLSVTGREAYGIAGTPDASAAAQEVWGNHVILTELCGAPPQWFRSGTAHYDDVAIRIVEALGERVAGFSVNGDGGATFTASQVETETAAAEAGDIVIAHFNQPGSGTADGMAAAIRALKRRGATFVTL